jgi:radical SAM-linked protein
VVARVRIRYAKRDRLRFTSHRDVARAFERALRRADVPIAYSAGFTPHPKVSYAGAAPTGAASEAEYLEIGLAREIDAGELRTRLDAALPPGLDIVDAVPAGGGALADRIKGSLWRIELPGVQTGELRAAVDAFLARDNVAVERLTRDGRRIVDARGPIVRIDLPTAAAPPADVTSTGTADVRAIMEMVVRQATPAVRPDDVVAALHDVAGLAPTGPPRVTRLAQGPVDGDGRVGDPLAPDRAGAAQQTDS